jgi:hypothetical protein
MPTILINNGDVFEWRQVWPAIAETLGMDVGPDEPLSLAETMPPREAEWQALVRRHDLRAPERFADFVGQGFVYADLQFAYGAKRTPPTTLRQHDQGAAGGVPRLHGFGGHVPEVVPPIPRATLAAVGVSCVRATGAGWPGWTK